MARCEIREGENCPVLKNRGIKPDRCGMPDNLKLPCPLAVAALTGDRSFAQGLAEYREMIDPQQVILK